MSRSVPLALAFAVSALGAACRPSPGLQPAEEAESLPPQAIDGTAGAQAPPPCASAPSFETDARVGFDPTHVGFAPNRVVVFGGGVYLPLFSLEGLDEGNDAVTCSTDVVEAGAGLGGLQVECQDGQVMRSATVCISGDRLEADVRDDGPPKHFSAPLGRCTRRLAADSLIPYRRGLRASDRECLSGASRRADGFLRLGTKERTTGLLPLLLEIPALGLRASIGEAASDPELCESGVTKRGWAWIKCSAGEDAAYAKVTPLPGQLVIDPASVGD